MLIFIFFSFFFVFVVYQVASKVESTFYNKKEDEDKAMPLNIKDFIVRTNSDAERVNNLEDLTVRFGKYKDQKWRDIPTNYLTWMIAEEEHKYVQIAKVLMAARACNYKYV